MWFRSPLFRVLAVFFFLAGVVLILFARSVVRNTAGSLSSGLEKSLANTNVNAGLRDSSDPLVSLAVGTPVILPTDPTLGPADARVTLVSFEDFACPFCAILSPRLVQVAREFPSDVRLVWKDFPIIEQHPSAQSAAEAARCADEQGKFWEYHEKLYEDVFTLNRARYVAVAESLGLQMTTFESCIDSRKTAKLVSDSLNHALNISLDGAPFVFLNGKEFTNVVTYEQIKAAVEEAIAE